MARLDTTLPAPTTQPGSIMAERPGRARRVLTSLRRHWPATIALAIIVAMLLVAILAPALAPYKPTKNYPRSSYAQPSAKHLLGTDKLGRDQFSRLLYGARNSVAVSIAAVGFSILIGAPLGLISGYAGGLVDDVLMRTTDALLAFPSLLLALGLVAALGRGLVTTTVAMGVAFTPWLARVVRSQVLSVRTRDYVVAARALGAPAWRIVARHIAPNSLAPAIVQGSLSMGAAVIIEASLSFIGAGIQPPTPSWGNMLYDAYQTIDRTPWLSIAPGVAIFLLVLSVNVFGDFLRDVLDPRLKTGAA